MASLRPRRKALTTVADRMREMVQHRWPRFARPAIRPPIRPTRRSTSGGVEGVGRQLHRRRGDADSTVPNHVKLEHVRGGVQGSQTGLVHAGPSAR